MSVHGELQATIVLASASSQESVTLMRRYFEACERFDWTTAEKLRIDVAARVEAYLDLIGAMFRRIDNSRRQADEG